MCARAREIVSQKIGSFAPKLAGSQPIVIE
jgi:hypothetical protein